jgi:hypothetical protein
MGSGDKLQILNLTTSQIHFSGVLPQWKLHPVTVKLYAEIYFQNIVIIYQSARHHILEGTHFQRFLCTLLTFTSYCLGDEISESKRLDT